VFWYITNYPTSPVGYIISHISVLVFSALGYGFSTFVRLTNENEQIRCAISRSIE